MHIMPTLRNIFKMVIILTCGPKPNGGGVIIVRAESTEAVEELIANDPFVTAGVQEYSIQEFNVFAIQEYAKEWKEA